MSDEDLRELELRAANDPAAAAELRIQRARRGLCVAPEDHDRLKRFDEALAFLMSRERTNVRCERTYDGKLVWNADIYGQDLTVHTQGATLEEAVEKLRARLRTFLGEGDLAK